MFCRDFITLAVLDYEGTVDDIDDDGVHEKHLDVNGGEADQVNVFWV